MTDLLLTVREAKEAERIEDALHGVQQCEIVTTWTMLDGIALYLSNLADKRQDNPEVEEALNLAAAQTLAAADLMKNGK